MNIQKNNHAAHTKIEIENVLPTEIEKRSFEIITEELEQEGIILPEIQAPITKRCIHTSADFDYAKNLVYSEHAVEKALEAIRGGASIVTDTQMGRSSHCGSYRGYGYGQHPDRSLAKFIKGYRENIEKRIAGYQFCQPIREAIELFESWLNERDPLKFFNLVIAAKDEAKVLIDKCKEVAQFTHDQLDTYKQLLQFLDDNQYNFPFVPMEMQGAVTDFNKLKNDPWPISGLRGYIKLQRQLSGILDGVRDELREKIKAAYNDMFDYLKQVTEKQHVPESVLSDRETVIRVKTTPTNILVLQNNANTDTFYQEQVDKIMSYNPPQPPGGEGDGKPEPPVTPEKRIRKASLQTKTKLPITNAEDIERYLEGLRQQLEKLLVDQDGVMIIK